MKSSSVTVRVPESSRGVLGQLAEREGVSMQTILQRAIEEYRRKRFLEDANVAFAALREDESAWSEEVAERGEWECTLADGSDRT